MRSTQPEVQDVSAASRFGRDEKPSGLFRWLRKNVFGPEAERQTVCRIGEIEASRHP